MDDVLILDGRKAKTFFTEKLQAKILDLDLHLKMRIIQIGDRAESNAYINSKIKFGEKIGVAVEHIKLSEVCSFEEVRNEIEKANANKDINGVIVQMPVPDSFDKQVVLDLVSPEKDVDGLSSVSKDKRMKGLYAPLPATARGVCELLDFYGINVSSLKVAVLGRSILAGGPIAEAISLKGGVVTVCHSKTLDEEKITKDSDLVIVAIGKPKFIDLKFFRNDRSQFVLDVGINKILGDDVSKMQEETPLNKFVGDVDFENVSKKASYITPVPGGVGPMTIAMLLKNTLLARENGIK
jgi:methylenetetrahydrofolate dehydrogenase (NADP+)/methenyltetrahydrofolate cyclohydrolase